jgi:copper(I)-binding protein
VPVPAHGQLIFAPNGYHAMLEKPTRALTVGSTLPVAFVFATGLKLMAQCDVRSPSGLSK